MRCSVSALVVGAVGLFTALGAASPAADSGGGQGRDMGRKMAQELGLSADQKAKLMELREEMRAARKDNADKLKALREQSREELLKPAPDKNALYGYAREMGDLHRAMAEKEADHMLKVKAILSADQFKKLLSKNFWQSKRPPGPPPEEGPGGGPPR